MENRLPVFGVERFLHVTSLIVTTIIQVMIEVAPQTPVTGQGSKSLTIPFAFTQFSDLIENDFFDTRCKNRLILGADNGSDVYFMKGLY